MVIYGRNTVLSRLEQGGSFEKILISGRVEGSLIKITTKARDMGINVENVDRKRIDREAQTSSHQGVVGFISDYKYCDVDDILRTAHELNEAPFVIICVKLMDPQNLGSIIRTAAAVGAHGVIITKHESVDVNASVAKVASGGLDYVKVARVTNINNVIKRLKDENIWVYGSSVTDGTSIFDVEFAKSGVALVVGNEGKGLSEVVLSKCDFLVNIPIKNVESLNVGVAAGLMMFARKEARG